jgi:hypothetical protein
VKQLLAIVSVACAGLVQPCLGQLFNFGINRVPDLGPSSISGVLGINTDRTAFVYSAYSIQLRNQAFRVDAGGSAVLLNPGSRNDVYRNVNESLDAFALTRGIARPEAMYQRFGEAPVPLGVRGGYAASEATLINRAGDIVYGYDYIEDSPTSTYFGEPFRWTPTGGRQNLGHVTSHAIFTEITSISNDGNIAVGYSGSQGNGQVFTWTPMNGYTLLPPPVGGNTVLGAGISSDGRIVVGGAGAGGGTFHAAIWRDFSQPPQLLTDWHQSSAEYIVRDGTMVIGQGRRNEPGIGPDSALWAFIWTPETGMMRPTAYLASVGIDLPAGTIIQRFSYVSDDGTMLGCTLDTPTGSYGALIVIPAPASVLMLALGMAPFARRRR